MASKVFGGVDCNSLATSSEEEVSNFGVIKRKSDSRHKKVQCDICLKTMWSDNFKRHMKLHNNRVATAVRTKIQPKIGRIGDYFPAFLHYFQWNWWPFSSLSSLPKIYTKIPAFLNLCISKKWFLEWTKL